MRILDTSGAVIEFHIRGELVERLEDMQKELDRLADLRRKAHAGLDQLSEQATYAELVRLAEIRKEWVDIRGRLHGDECHGLWGVYDAFWWMTCGNTQEGCRCEIGGNAARAEVEEELVRTEAKLSQVAEQVQAAQTEMAWFSVLRAMRVWRFQAARLGAVEAQREADRLVGLSVSEA